jgi:hypothetical protein
MSEPHVPRPRHAPQVALPYAVVSFGADRRLLVLGRELTIGRAHSCDLRIADNPSDDHVSRLSATVRTLEDCVLVRNESGSKPLALRPLVGSERVIGPREATTSLPHAEFFLVATGRFGAEYGVHIDVRDLISQAEPAGGDSQTPQTVSGPPISPSDAQRRMLAALCEPLLTRTGPKASPATYRQIGERVGRRPDYVRTVLKRLREQLAAQGVASLVGFSLDQVSEDFRLPLAMWAIHSGTISAADLAGLDHEDLDRDGG